MKEKEPLYPRICVCIFGETSKNNYQSLLKFIFNIFSEKDKEDTGFYYIEPFKLSLHSYHDDDIDKKKKIGYEYKLWIMDAKENFEKSINVLENLKRKIKDKKKSEIIKYIDDLHKKALTKNTPKKGICKFRFEIKLFVYKKLSTSFIEKGDFIGGFKNINKLLTEFNKFKIKANGYTCNSLVFNSKKYAILGNIELPFDLCDIQDVKKLPFASTLIQQLGTPKLDGVSFEIVDSPIGLEQIALRFDKNNYIVPMAFNYKTDNIDNLIKRNYLQSLNIAKIIMRRIK